MIDTGDTVRHHPSDEEWLVACAHPEEDALYPLGWPPTRAKLSDCALVEKAPAETRAELLAKLAEGRGGDHRCLCSRVRLAAPGPSA